MLVPLLGLVAAASAQSPTSGWGAPKGLDLQSPLTNCDQARAAGNAEPICGWKMFSDVGTVGSLVVGGGAAGAYTLFNPTGGGRYEPAAAWVSGLAVALGAAQIVKMEAGRPRPYTWNQGYQPSGSSCRSLHGADRDDCWSFFSGHTELTAFNLFYAASAVDMYSGPARSPVAVGLGYGVAVLGTALIGTARVEAGQHYWSDVAVGAVVGAGLGLASPRVTRVIAGRFEEPIEMQVSPVAFRVSGEW